MDIEGIKDSIIKRVAATGALDERMEVELGKVKLDNDSTKPEKERNRYLMYTLYPLEKILSDVQSPVMNSFLGLSKAETKRTRHLPENGNPRCDPLRRP